MTYLPSFIAFVWGLLLGQLYKQHIISGWGLVFGMLLAILATLLFLFFKGSDSEP